MTFRVTSAAFASLLLFFSLFDAVHAQGGRTLPRGRRRCPRLSINPATHADGSMLAPGQYVNPTIPSAGGTHFAVRDKDQNDNLFDDGFIVQTESSLQLGAKPKQENGKPVTFGAEILVLFDSPVTAHRLGIFDPEGDSACSDRVNGDMGMVQIYGRKGLITSVYLPSSANGAETIDLGDASEVVKIVIDTGAGCWKTIDQVEITPPCGLGLALGRGRMVGGGALSHLSPETRMELADIAQKEGKKIEYPECVGIKVEECVKIVEGLCPECAGRVKAATPRVFDFYRIWIKCDDKGKVVGVPTRG